MNIVEWFEQLLLFGLHVPLTAPEDTLSVEMAVAAVAAAPSAAAAAVASAMTATTSPAPAGDADEGNRV